MKNERLNHSTGSGEPARSERRHEPAVDFRIKPDGTIELALGAHGELAIKIEGWPPGGGGTGWPPGEHPPQAALRDAAVTPPPPGPDTGWPPGGPLQVVVDYVGASPGDHPQHYVLTLATGWPPGGPKETYATPAGDDPEDEAPDREE